MDSGRKIFTNTAFLSASSLINLTISIATTAIIARYIGPVLYGKYTFGLTYVVLLSTFANFGIESFVIRETSKDRLEIKRRITNVLYLKTTLSIFAIIIGILIAYLLNYPKSTINVIYILTLGLFFQTVYESLVIVYKSKQKMHIVALFRLLFRAITAIIIVLVVHTNIGFFGIVWSFSIGNTILALSCLALVIKGIYPFPLRVDLNQWKNLVRKGFPFNISALLSMTYCKINIILLTKMVGELEFGIYMAANTLLDALLFLPDAFSTSVFPGFSKIHGTSRDGLKKVFAKITKYSVIASLAVCLGTILVADRVMLTIFGPDFQNSTDVIKILIFFWPLLLLSHTQSNLLFAVGEEKLQAKIMGLACLFSIFANVILIKLYGIHGGALALVTSELSVVAIFAIILARKDYHFQLDAYLIRLLPVAGIMILTVKLLRLQNIFLAVCCGAFSYIICLFIFKVFDGEDLTYFRSFPRITKRSAVSSKNAR